jgi:maltose alpha-D-glucosyltransferase/alpha-amylase
MLEHDPLWYKDAIIYEVHVRAFQDSAGSGMGDFRGLTQKLDYLEDLGVTAVWVLPFYPSPWRDDGYDIADYTSVHPAYGDLRDFRNFLDGAHRRGIRVLTELVINHTSDRHPWFQRARRAPAGSPERDFYVWSDTADRYAQARIIFKDFEPSNWTWDPVARQYYWHRFYAHQPDLNFDNKAVWDALFPVLDFWMEMGVDGMRLDAIPYLYEREGTGCENLPETHEFLKALRRHVDARFPGKMFLAEANQWPEDAVAYFGQGDECQMAFHFPVMPRLFMSLHMEDRFPILDIMAQTPAIPDNCQWCMFLRNHDELTLEMVTDEERDYMYRAYAEDPQARINLGIRRRLAPLLRNDRRRIELMNALLFSLPGAPVVYYGDEIGMGDNIYLGDRNGVRTPMQWSPDRNAGFSRANPQKLYLPVIVDPEYHFEAVNVQAQQQNPSSLLWWTKHLIGQRKRHRAFSRGTLEFLHPDNPKVLAFLRRLGDEVILVVANLSRFPQHASIDLKEFKGLAPEELFGRSQFPDVGEAPYGLSLGRYGFYWFELTHPRVEVLMHAQGLHELPLLSLGEDWVASLNNSGRDRMEAVLPEVLRRRWPGGRAPEIATARIAAVHPFREAETRACLLFVRVEVRAGIPETVLLPLAFIPEDQAGRLLEPVERAAVVRVGGPSPGLLCDALTVPEYSLALLERIGHGQTYTTGEGEIIGVALPRLREILAAGVGDGAPVFRRTERNNPSVTFGGRLILKTFRRVEAGTNPDLEIGRFLTERRVDWAPPVAGYVEYRPHGGETCTLAVLEEFVPNQGDAWQWALDLLSRYFEGVLSHTREAAVLPPPIVPLLGPAVTELHEELQSLLGGFFEPVRALARRTALLHRTLASDPADPAFAPEPVTSLHQRSLYQSLRNLTASVCTRLARRQGFLPAGARDLAERVVSSRDVLLRQFRGVLDRSINGQRIRCHGDYHLGEAMYTGSDWIIIDFEGDPARPLGERRVKRSPLRDVACMVRSFDYVVSSALLGLATSRGRAPGWIRPEDRPALQPWADAWANRVAREFVVAYDEAAVADGLVPSTVEARRLLLHILCLEKALQEVEHELSCRPEWTALPLRAVLRLLEGA